MWKNPAPSEHRPDMSSKCIGVQPVTPEAYDAILLLGEKGGWDDLISSGKKSIKRKSTVEDDKGEDENAVKPAGRGRKAKPKAAVGQDTEAQDKKITRQAKRQKADAQLQVADDKPESDLSDLPSSDLSEEEQPSPPLVSANNENTKNCGKPRTDESRYNSQLASLGTRRSARQRTAKAEK